MRFIAFALALLVALPVGAQDLELALDAAARGDFVTALKELRPLADQGHKEAQFALGVMYETGRGVPQEYGEAFQWYEKSATQGDTAAQNGLGSLYQNGKGIPVDYAKARGWYNKAAELGDIDAQFNLGIMYSTGLGPTGMPDFVAGHLWFNLAASRGHTDARRARKMLEERMNRAQLALAQRLAREWTEKHGK